MAGEVEAEVVRSPVDAVIERIAAQALLEARVAAVQARLSVGQLLRTDRDALKGLRGGGNGAIIEQQNLCLMVRRG